MADDFTRRFQYGLSDLPVEPPDDPNAMFSPNGFTAIGMQRAGQAQHMPAQFRLPARRMPPPYPGQRGLAPGGGQLPEIPVPPWWKYVGPMLDAAQLLPNILESRARGKRRSNGNACHERYEEEEAECRRNNVDPAHRDFLSGCITRAEDRRNMCLRNGGRPHPDEPAKWRAGSDKNPGDEEVWRNPDR